MTTRHIGSGRTREGGAPAVHKQDFEAHRTGGDWRHESANIDVDPVLTGVTGATVRAVLQNLSTAANSKLVVVGDGAVSYGEFSSTTAIQQAIAAYGTVSSLVILVKNGHYNITTPGITIPANLNLTLIGYGGNIAGTSSAWVMDSYSTALVAAITVNGSLNVSGITFIRSLGLGILADLSNSHSVNFENCYFKEVIIRGQELGAKVSFIDCKFENTSALGFGDGFFYMSPTASVFNYGVSFERCIFIIAIGEVAVHIFGASIGGGYGAPTPFVLEYVKFKDCMFTVKSLNVSPVNAGTTLSVVKTTISLGPGGPTLGTFFINEIAFSDCDVYAEGTSTNSGALYLNVPSAIILEKLLISGGRWMVESTAVSATGPFFIGSNNAQPGDSSNIKKVEIDGLQFGWGNITKKEYGTDNNTYGIHPTELTWNWGDNYWGAMTISAWDIIINNLQFRGLTKVSTEVAEITLIPGHSLLVDGVFMDDFVGSGVVLTSYPAGRFIVVDPGSTTYSPGQFHIKNVLFDFVDGTVISTGGIITARSLTAAPDIAPVVVFEDCKVANTLSTGFYLEDDNGTGIYARGNYYFINCHSIKNMFGFAYDNAATNVGKITIKGGEYSYNFFAGIYISGDGFGSGSKVEISGITAQWNATVGLPGVYLYSSAAHLNENVGWTVLNNKISHNNITSDDVQLAIYGTTSVVTTVLGNDCAGDAANLGIILLSSGVPNSYYVVGGQSNGVLWPAGLAAPPFLSGVRMDLNQAILAYS